MAYEPRPGSLSLFKNDRKEKDSHPDYKGDGMDLDGNAVWISAWIKEGAKGKFMSVSIQRKEAPAAPSAHDKPAPKGYQPPPMADDDLPPF